MVRARRVSQIVVRQTIFCAFQNGPVRAAGEHARSDGLFKPTLGPRKPSTLSVDGEKPFRPLEIEILFRHSADPGVQVLINHCAVISQLLKRRQIRGLVVSGNEWRPLFEERAEAGWPLEKQYVGIE